MAKISVADLERSNIGSVYVLNRTSGQQRSDIVFTVPGINGGQGDSVVVPSTWIPVELTIFATRQQLLNSVPFRRMVHEGHLEIISEEDAANTLSTPEAREEVELVRNQQRLTETLSGSPEMVVGNEDIVDPARKRAAQQAKTGSVESTEPDAVIQQLVMRLNNEEITEGQAISTIRTMMADLTKADLQYMLENVKEKKFSRVVVVVREEALRKGLNIMVEDNKEQ